MYLLKINLYKYQILKNIIVWDCEKAFCSPNWSFPGFSSALRQMPGDMCTVHHFIITLIVGNRCDWRETRDKWSLASNPDRSWWHRHTSIDVLGRNPYGSMDNGGGGMIKNNKLRLPNVVSDSSSLILFLVVLKPR